MYKRQIDIDETSIEKYGQWPWPRNLLARLVDRLTEAGSAVIAFDIVFSEADRTSPKNLLEKPALRDTQSAKDLAARLGDAGDHDKIFAESIARANTVMAFFNSTEQSTNRIKPLAGYTFVGKDPKPVLTKLNNAIGNLSILFEGAKGFGSANPNPNSRDDIIRRIPMFLTLDDKIFPNLGLEALRVALQAPSFAIKTTGSSSELDTGELAVTHGQVGNFAFPLTGDGQLEVYYARQQPDRYISAADALDASIDELATGVSGHIVFIGTSAAGLRDLRTNALGEVIPGVSVHAQVVDQILDQKFLTRPDIAPGIEKVMMTVAVLLLLSLVPFLSALRLGIVGVALSLIIVAISWIAFSQYGILIDPTYPLLTLIVIFLLAILLMYALTEREKIFVRNAFQQYLAPDLLNRLEKNPDMLRLGGEIRHMTILFMDIRGFTPISEKLTPEELVTFLNTLLSPLTEVILKHEGTIDKYIGDSIMAFWNAPLDVADHPTKAAKAALEMMRVAEKLNKDDAFGFKRHNKGLGDVQIGIGMSTGKGCVGNLGSTNRFDYSVVGDTVNVASRVESSCKAVGWPVLLAQSTAQECPDLATLRAGEIELKGKSEPQLLYALLGDESLKSSDDFTGLKHHHETLMRAINAARPENEILRLKEAFKKNAPEDMGAFIDAI